MTSEQERSDTRAAEIQTRPPGLNRTLWWLHCATVAISSFLLFSIQPVIGRLLLPAFGGSASVWSACMLSFQAMLLLGYAYADWTSRHLGLRKQALLHAAALALSLVALPIQISPGLAADLPPAARIVLIIVAGVGAPYLLLSATSPLLQVWYAQAEGIRPYRLYALSNLASLMALVSYPTLVEPSTTGRTQLIVWSAGFVVFVLMCGSAALFARVGPARRFGAEARAGVAPALKTRVLWVMLAGIPSALLLATTNHLCQNVAAIPFLWIAPLVVYLLTLILCFDFDREGIRVVFRWLTPGALAAMGYACLHSTFSMNPKLLIPLFCTGLFIVCMTFHGELVARKPDPAHLTSFYLTMSLGGAVGSALIVWAAPALLSGVYEFPLLVAGSATFLLFLYYRKNWYTDVVFTAASIAAVVFAAAQIQLFAGGARVSMRNFYGALRIVETPGVGKSPAIRTMVHGTVSHGAQFQDAGWRELPTTYYAHGTGAQMALDHLRRGPQTVGVIGLGAGTLAAYALPGDHYVFYELNPQVIGLARSEFTYLSKPGVEVIEGDGRLALERDTRMFDVIVLDAFSGDAIPTHLLTQEAVAIYLRHLKPDGVLAMHISNSVLDLEPTVQKLAESAGLVSEMIHTGGDPKSDRSEAYWALMARSAPRLDGPKARAAARPLHSITRLRVWTDDYSNLFELLKTQ